MAQHLTKREWIQFIAISALLASLAALAVPGPSSNVTEIAATLALGAIALFAGHRWGLLIVGAADVLLLGHVWPLLVFGNATGWTWAIAGAVLACAIPGLLFITVIIPRTVDLVLGPHSEWAHSAGVTCCALLLAVGVLLPALQFADSATAIALATAL